MKALQIAVRSRDREALVKQMIQIQNAGHKLLAWKQRSEADVRVSLGAGQLLQIRAHRKKIDIPADSSAEEINFWINELGYTGKRAAGDRAPLVLDVELAYGDGVAKTRTVDISSSGIFVRSAAPPHLGASLGVILYLDDGDEPLRALGQVVHVVKEQDSALGDESGKRRIAHPGVAVDLVGLSAQGKQRLARRVASAIAQKQQMY